MEKNKQFCSGLRNTRLGRTLAKRNLKDYVAPLSEANELLWIFNDNTTSYPEGRSKTWAPAKEGRTQPSYAKAVQQNAATTDEPSGNSTTPGANQTVCRRCRREGHWASECTQAITCFKCGQEGHMSRECPTRAKVTAVASEEVGNTGPADAPAQGN